MRKFHSSLRESIEASPLHHPLFRALWLSSHDSSMRQTPHEKQIKELDGARRCRDLP